LEGEPDPCQITLTSDALCELRLGSRQGRVLVLEGDLQEGDARSQCPQLGRFRGVGVVGLDGSFRFIEVSGVPD
jgi:hypothetical protein